MKVLIIDNYDSFVYNLVQLIGSLNTETYVYRNNEIKSDEIKKINPDRIVISPGPGNPKNSRDFGICSSILSFPERAGFPKSDGFWSRRRRSGWLQTLRSAVKANIEPGRSSR